MEFTHVKLKVQGVQLLQVITLQLTILVRIFNRMQVIY